MKYLYFLLLLPFTFFAQVTVDINSGNPAFPFPQFLAYQYDGGHSLGNLGTQNADGLVHAEMEKRIREAWLIMANRFIYDGDSHAGVQYIKSNEGCPYDCSEGAGYAMIGAAYMGDKTSFDGIWFREHDLRMVKQPRYIDGVTPRPGYSYGEFALAEPGGDSAADGDVDIALGLLMAWRQWGDDSGYVGDNGEVISYKQDALNVIRGLVERQNQGFGDCRSVSGIIGFDGYIKGGNTWKELTNWSSDSNLYEGMCPEFSGPTDQHIDYVAPAYFKDFAAFLEAEGEGDIEDADWHIPQLERAEASSDWFMGELYNQGPNTVPVAGWVNLDASNNATFTNFQDGEDFRYAWRTILNHTWHGNPNINWNPNTHEVEVGSNSFNQDMGVRFSEFMKDPGAAGNGCKTPGTGMSFNGPSQLVQYYDPNTGAELSTFPLNWLVGAGSPSAVTAQDFYLMGKLYRQCAIEWDQQSGQNLDSVPKYFHGFFRLLGMLITTGNFQAPMSMEPQANIKVYSDVDKTFSFTNDEVTYTFSYRNYGSIAAQNVVITDLIPEGLEFVSATGGGVLSGTSVVWNVNNVPGFTSDLPLENTTGEVSVTFKVKEAFSGRVCNPATITTTSGQGWTSNDFPNVDSEVMKRNCIDIVEKALEIEKTVDYEEVNPGDVVTYTVNVTNSSKGGYINGGRSGVNFSYARGIQGPVGDTQGLKIRLFHGADEPYIDYQNYRVSVFLNDNVYKCIQGEEGCTTGWALRSNTYEGGDADGVIVSQEDIVPGSDEGGKWNQRVIVQFAEQLSGPTPHLLRYAGLARNHEGGDFPLRGVWQLYTSNNGDSDWSDDWSWNLNGSDDDGGFYYPVTNDWTDPDNPDQVVDIYHNEACEKPSQTVNNVLIEEWDGYTWRRIYGSGPVPGRDVENVVFRDVLPEGFEFVEFVGEAPLGINPVVTDEAGRTVITWKTDRLQIGQDVQIMYKAIAGFSAGKTCDTADENQTNLASVSANNEAPIEASVDVLLTCNPVILPPPPSSMVKEVFPISAEVGDQVVYTLSYKNEDGSPIEVPLTEASNWTTQTGALMTIGGNSLANITNSTQISTYNYSHGTNGFLEASIDFAENAQFGFALRHTGGAIENGLYLVFKPGPTTIQISFYDGTTLLDEVQFGTPGSSTQIKVLLNEGDLNVWLGDLTSPSPSWVASGLPIRTGNFGFINGTPTGQDTWGSHAVTRFYSAMDSAFNVQITDPIPGELSFVASAEGTNVDDVVTFPILTGPVLAGAEIGYEWTAEIVSCPADLQKIDNVAYTNIFGIETNSIAAQAILDCSGLDLCGETPPMPELLQGEEIVVCETIAGELNLTAYVTVTSTDYALIWFDGPSKFDNEIDQPIIDTSEEVTSTYYVAQIEDVVCGEGDRVAITFTIGGGGLEGFNDADTIDSGETLAYDLVALGLTSGVLSWQATDNENVSGETLTAVNSDMLSDTLVNETDIDQEIIYTVTETAVDGCPRGNSVITITVAPSLMECNEILVPEVENATLCLNALEIIDLNNYVTASGEIFWYADNIPESVAIAKLEVDLSTPIEITYYVSQKIDDCESERVPIEVIVTDEILIPEVENVNESVCNFDGLNYSLATYVEATGILVWYTTESSINNIATPFFSKNEELDITYYVSQIIGTCESARVPIQVVVQDTSAEAVVVTKEIYTNSSVAYNISAELSVDTSKYVWIAQDNPNVTGESTIENSEALIGDVLMNTTTVPQEVVYLISPTVCEENTYELIVTVKPLPSVEIFITSVTEGEAIEISLAFSEATLSDTNFAISFTPTTVNGVSIEDISLVDELITVPAGSITYTFTRPTIDDATFEENNEQVIVSIESANPSEFSSIDTSDIGTIFDNDGAPNVIISDVSILEGETGQIPIELSHPAIDDITITIEIIDISTTSDDYEVVSQTITFSAGNILPNIPINVKAIDDTFVETNEFFEVKVISVVEGSLNDTSDIADVTIEDNDQVVVPDVVIGNNTVVEGGVLQIPITLSSPAIDSVELLVSFNELTATPTLDFDASPQTLVFNIGETTPTIPLLITTVDDENDETTEEFMVLVTLVGGTLGNSNDTGIGTIEDNDTDLVVTAPGCAVVTNPENGEMDVTLRPTISWDEVMDADGYLLSVGTNEFGTDVVATIDVNDNTNYFIASNLEGNTTYYVSVTPYNIAGSALNCNTTHSFTTEETVAVSKTKYGLSPDGDGINEFWQIDNIEDYPDNEVYVYNRWGNLVFRMKNYDNSFNVFSGEANEQTNLGAGELLSGTYFYEIKINGAHDFSDLKGFLVLKR